MQIAFLGFGLIAGSIARAVRPTRRPSDWTMAAWSPSGEGPRQAAADGVIDVAARKRKPSCADADLVVLAGAGDACLALIDALGGPWRTALPADADRDRCREHQEA